MCAVKYITNVWTRGRRRSRYSSKILSSFPVSFCLSQKIFFQAVSSITQCPTPISSSITPHRFETTGSSSGYLLFSQLPRTLWAFARRVSKRLQKVEGVATGLSETTNATLMSTKPWNTNPFLQTLKIQPVLLKCSWQIIYKPQNNAVYTAGNPQLVK